MVPLCHAQSDVSKSCPKWCLNFMPKVMPLANAQSDASASCPQWCLNVMSKVMVYFMFTVMTQRRTQIWCLYIIPKVMALRSIQNNVAHACLPAIWEGPSSSNHLLPFAQNIHTPMKESKRLTACELWHCRLLETSSECEVTLSHFPELISGLTAPITE